MKTDDQDLYQMTKDWLVLSQIEFFTKYHMDWTPPPEMIGSVKNELSIRKNRKGEYRHG